MPSHCASFLPIHPPWRFLGTTFQKTFLFLLLQVFDWFLKRFIRFFSWLFGKCVMLNLQLYQNRLLVCLSSFALAECFEYQEIYQETHWGCKKNVYFFYRFSWKKKTWQKMIQIILCFSFFVWLTFLKPNKTFELNLKFL